MADEIDELVVIPDMSDNVGLDEAIDSLSQDKNLDEKDDEGEGQEDDSLEPGNDAEQDESTDDDEETDADDADADDDDTSDDETDFVFTYTDKETGEESGVDAEEARLGYLRQKAFTQKTQALSKEMTDVTAAKASLLEQSTQVVHVLEQLTLAADTTMQEFTGVDWVALQRDDPMEYEEKAARYQAAKVQRDVTVDQQTKLTAELQKQYEGFYAEEVQKENDKLYELAPEFNPDNGGVEFRDNLNLFGEEYGFTPDELKAVVDNRMLRVLKDAQAYQALNDKVKIGKDKIKTDKTLKPNRSRKTKTKAKDAAKERMLKTHSIDDALAFITHG